MFWPYSISTDHPPNGFQRELFYSFSETIRSIIRLNSPFCCPYCWLLMEKVPPGTSKKGPLLAWGLSGRSATCAHTYTAYLTIGGKGQPLRVQGCKNENHPGFKTPDYALRIEGHLRIQTSDHQNQLARIKINLSGLCILLLICERD